jgi:hypothetical protein
MNADAEKDSRSGVQVKTEVGVGEFEPARRGGRSRAI